MTTQEAIDLYNNATGCSLKIYDLPYSSNSVKKAIEMLEKTSKYARRLGGELRSRQLIALIIANAELS